MYKGFKNQVDNEMPPIWKILKPNTDKVVGQQVKFSAQVENPQGVGSRLNSSQILPAAVPGKYIELAVPTGRIYGVLEFDSKMLLAAGTSADGRRAYVNYLENELKGLKNTMIHDLSRQAFGSKKGFVATCGTTAGVLVLQLATTANMRHFVEGQHIDIVTTATGVAIANGLDRVIQSVDVAAKTVTLDTAGGVVTTDATISVTRQGSYNAEMTGLSAIVSDTEDIYGITTATSRRWRSYVKTGTGAFAIKAVVKAMLESEAVSGVFPDIIVSSADVQAQYWYELTGVRTYATDRQPIPVQKLGIGYYGLEVTVAGNPALWISDKNCPESEIYGLRKEDLGIQHLAEMDFMKVSGEILLPNIYGSTGTPTYKAVLEYYPEIIAMRRNSHMKMTGVTPISGW
jgi:hypothetical protein